MSRGKARSGGGARNNKAVIIRGVKYDSQREAAEKLGVTDAVISRAKAHGWLDRVGLMPQKNRFKGNG